MPRLSIKKKLNIGFVHQYIEVLSMLFYIYCIHDFLQKELKVLQKIKISEPFKNLFTQGMVCQTYKDEMGNWLYPDEIEKVSKSEAIIKDSKKNVIVGPSESMSQLKRILLTLRL